MIYLYIIYSIDNRSSRSSPAFVRGCAGSAYRTAVVQIQRRHLVLDHADYTAPTRRHELDHTDHTDHLPYKVYCV